MSECGLRVDYTACTVYSSRSEQSAVSGSSSKDIIKNAWRAFASRYAALVSEVFTADAQWLAPEGNATAAALGHTHHMVGREAIVRFLTEEFPKLFVADVSVKLNGIYADGDTVVVEERMQATLANGRKYDNEYCFVFTLSAGRISFVKEYMDTKRGFQCIFG